MNRKRSQERSQETRPLLPEGIGELAADLPRHRRFVLAVILGQLALGHPERSEQNVPERERASEIAVAALFQSGVMPAMEYRGRQHIFERPQRPVQVGMHESRMEGRERS